MTRYPYISQYFGHKFNPISIPHFISQYSHFEPAQRDINSIHTLMGRVVSKREASKALTFLDIESEDAKVQIMATKQSFSEPDQFRDALLNINRGDILATTGFPAKTKLAELSLVPLELQVLSPCLHDIPEKLEDPGLRFGSRYLDFLVNPDNISVLKQRFEIISTIRSFLSNLGYLEVETPILSSKSGGAIALPFHTKSRYINEPLYLRIAPELFLKKLIIGGMDGIFEIGKQFRNEGFDATHNAEFTTVELYKPYIPLEHLYTLTEDLFKILIQQYRPDLSEYLIAPFPRVSIPQALVELTSYKFTAADFSGNPSKDATQAIQTIVGDDDITDWTVLMNKTIDIIENNVAEKYPKTPVFLTDHPIVASPLAKEHETLHGCCERFELFIDGREYVNAYNELNDPIEQKKRFHNQAAKTSDDTKGKISKLELDCMPADLDFVHALEFGLPPTCGWGLGIDRLAMLLTNQNHIREVLPFPTH